MNTARLPININDLLHGRVVEHDRLEYKTGWNPDPIVRNICAFANDFENRGGGYIIIGVEEKNGLPVLPPKGVNGTELDTIQKKLQEYGNLIQPAYFPVLSIETVRGKKIVVLWCFGGPQRPYKAPKAVTASSKDYHHYIRRYSNSVIAKEPEVRELIELAANVPFDDRINHNADLSDLKLPLIQSFLREIGSELTETSSSLPFTDLCRQMRIIDGSDEYLKPRNVGLMFFNDSPETFFPMARIETVLFVDDVGGDVLEERTFTGPLDQQLRAALSYLRNTVIRERVVKHRDRAKATRAYSYPFAALEEALVNAVYHRSYELREPIEVRINPDAIEILSYPGPDRSISLARLNGGNVIARRYRNRRVGDILKELDLTEGRGTGIPKIRRALKENGSPEPTIETDEDRTYFLIRIPIHPRLNMPMKAQDEAHDWAQDEAHDWAQVGDRNLTQEGGHSEELVALNETEYRLLKLAKRTPIDSQRILNELEHATLSGNVRRALDRLMKLGLLEYTIPDRPRSKLQQRRITPLGRRYLKARR
ncbi:MAG TPA: RNA-binding domain-containing protein [Candidatus Kapabacteria bacterium]|nr:RNA-binding domain-containing protein [Candidatus Kapabacteria bacterium]